MPHDLPKAYDPTAIEDHWAAYWVREKLFDVATPGIAADPSQRQTHESSAGQSADHSLSPSCCLRPT